MGGDHVLMCRMDGMANFVPSGSSYLIQYASSSSRLLYPMRGNSLSGFAVLSTSPAI